MKTTAKYSAPKHYRADIDGLRAIAVLGVVIFHIWPTALSGGFLGVDMFFVISGYLITTNIMRRKHAGTFTFKSFYLSRIKRLFPAVLFLIACTLAAAYFILLPKDRSELLLSALFSVLQSANVFFTYFVDTGYFADDSATKPLLHLWSLAVEEQYYFIWPTALLLILKLKGKYTRLAIVLGAMGLSFWHGEVVIQKSAEYAYYMLPARAAELLGGIALSFAVRDKVLRPLQSTGIRSVLAIIGIIILIFCFGFMAEADSFPGFSAMPIVVATVCLLYAGLQGQHILSPFLTLRPVIFIGLISYALYLWHWPILAFARYSFIEINLGMGLMLFALMLAGSVVSYYCVERPIRYGADTFTKAFVKYSLAPVLLCAAAVMFIHLNVEPIAPATTQTEIGTPIKTVEIRAAYSYPEVLQKPRLEPVDLKSPRYLIGPKGENQKKILLWGDSNAAQFVGMFKVFSEAGGFSFRNASHSSCPPTFGNVDKLIQAKVIEHCRHSRKTMQKELKKYEVVIIGASWNSYARKGPVAAMLDDTIKPLLDDGKQIILILQMQRLKGLDKDCQARAAINPKINCQSLFTMEKPTHYPVNDELIALAEKYDNVSYFDPNTVICDNGVCSAYLPRQ